MDGLGCRGLMGVQAAYAFGSVGGGEVGVDPGREVRPLGFAGREMVNRCKGFAGVVARSESIQHFVDAGDCGRQASSANGERFRHGKVLSFIRLLFANASMRADTAQEQIRASGDLR